MKTIHKALGVAVVLLSALQLVVAEKLCVSVSYSKRTGKVVTQRSVAVRCPKGWTELVDTQKFRGEKGEPGEGAPGIAPAQASSIKTVDSLNGSTACPSGGLQSLYTVPAGKNYVVTQFVGSGTNAGIAKVGEVLNNIKDWKLNTPLFSAYANNFSYTSSRGLVFRGGSSIVVSCAPAGSSIQSYHIDGFLVDEGTEFGSGGAGGPGRVEDVWTVDSSNLSPNCPNSQLLTLFSVPEGKNLILTDFVGRGSNVGYSTVGELVDGVTEWRIDGALFKSSDNAFKYSSAHGVLFRSGSAVVMTCSSIGAPAVAYHAEGFLLD